MQVNILLTMILNTIMYGNRISQYFWNLFFLLSEDYFTHIYAKLSHVLDKFLHNFRQIIYLLPGNYWFTFATTVIADLPGW